MNREDSRQVLWGLVSSVGDVSRRLQDFGEEQETLLRSVNLQLQNFVEQDQALISAMAALTDMVRSVVLGLEVLQQQPEVPEAAAPALNLSINSISGAEAGAPPHRSSSEYPSPAVSANHAAKQPIELRSGRKLVKRLVRSRPYRRKK